MSSINCSNGKEYKEPRDYLIKSQEIKDYLNTTCDFDYFTKIDVAFVEKIIELESKAENRDNFISIIADFESTELIELLKQARIGKALLWAKQLKQCSWISIADTPDGSFCDGLDIEFLLNLYDGKGDL